MIAAETGVMIKAGGIEDQPDWFIELLGWFLPRYDMAKFSNKANMVLGSDSGTKAKSKALFNAVKGGKGGSHNR